MSARQNRLWFVALLATVIFAVALNIFRRMPPRVVSPEANESEPSSVAQLLALPNTPLSGLDIARMNILCADDLPGPKGGALDGQLATLDAWAERIASETTRHSYRYRHNPKEFNHSEGFFRMLMMAVVLTEDFDIKYDPALRASPGAGSSNDGFFSAPDKVFLHGLLGPERKGTCSSLPVLYVALGRRRQVCHAPQERGDEQVGVGEARHRVTRHAEDGPAGHRGKYRGLAGLELQALEVHDAGRRDDLQQEIAFANRRAA